MEIWIIILIFSIVYCVGLGSLFYFVKKGIDRNTYIHLKTGNKYIVKRTCLMKNNTSREWEKAILYTSFETGELFVREELDFVDKFIPLEEWKKRLEIE